MPPSDSNPTDPAPIPGFTGMPGASFPTTKWDVVHILQSENGTSHSDEAYTRLCEEYWPPIHSYLLRYFSFHEAQDVAQDFFLNRVQRLGLFMVARPDKGRLRNLIQRSLKWHVQTHLRLVNYSKTRGGTALHLELEEAENEAALTHQDSLDFHKLDLDWAREAHALLMAKLEKEYQDSGKARIFKVLSHRLEDHSYQTYETETALLGNTPEANRVTVFRMRKRYLALARQLVDILWNEKAGNGPDRA
ncbi:MAG: hypothetical protein AAF514_19610 [Verrucomicrobiota bacterium]